MKLALREIDAMVAEKVMGWKYVMDVTGFMVWDTGDLKRYTAAFTPTESIHNAWEVIEKLYETWEEHNWEVPDDNPYLIGIWKCRRDTKNQWVMRFRPGMSEDFGYPTREDPMTYSAPLAICLAALKARGIEVEVAE